MGPGEGLDGTGTAKLMYDYGRSRLKAGCSQDWLPHKGGAA